MKLRILVALALLLGGVLPFIPAAAQAEGDPFSFTDCPFIVIAEVEVNCGYLAVPEDRGDPNSPTIYLAVAIIHSTSANPLPDPVVYLEGGPGGSALSGYADWFESPILEQRDIILIDQRGTGFSEPFLGCPVEEESEASAVEAAEACRDALLAEGVNLAAYNSAASAADLNDLRLALGIEQWNLYGISYGTRLALTTMRDYPEGIRSVVIDSVYPPEIGGYIDQPINGYLAFSAMFQDCAANPECAAAFPNLESVFYETVERLNDSPAQFTDPYAIEWEYYGDDLINDLFQLLYDSNAIPYLPLMLSEMSQGNYSTYFSLLFGDAEAYVETLPADLANMPEDGLDELLAYYEYDSLDALAADLPTWGLEDLETLSADIFFFSIPPEVRDEAMMAYLEIENVDALWEQLDAMDEDQYLDLINAVFYPENEVLDSDGMYNSVECYEEIPFNPYEQAEAVTDSSGMPDVLEETFLADVSNQIEVCALWGADVASDIENMPVASDIPTLVVAGSYDPITPPSWAESAARNLTHSYYFVYPGMGHGVTAEGCALDMMLDFLDDPTTAPDDTCLREMGPPDFELP